MDENYILLVEDSETQAVRLMEMLKELGYGVVHKSNGKDALDFIDAQSTEEMPDLILSDISMPVMDGYGLCRAVKNKYPDMILIMITSTDDEDAMNKAYLAGASDFVTKPISKNELLVRINNLIYVKIAELQVKCLLDELKKKNDVLSKLSITDELTSQYNRRYVIEQLDLRTKESIRYETPLSIIMLDLDHFKEVNDSCGHAVGDEILIEISFNIKSSIREYDLFGRYGGEEFLVILPNTDLKAACCVAQKINKTINSLYFDKLPNKCITISCGVAEFKKNMRYKELIEAADKCLYKAKLNGRNRVES